MSDGRRMKSVHSHWKRQSRIRASSYWSPPAAVSTKRSDSVSWSLN